MSHPTEVVHERAVRRAEVVAEQLQGALNSRIIVEPAKGRLAQHSAIARLRHSTAPQELTDQPGPALPEQDRRG